MEAMDCSTSAVVSKPENFSAKFSWPEEPSIKQYFTLPSSIMYYIARNPKNPNFYQKMVKICKYFFEKNPILVADKISYGEFSTNFIQNKKKLSDFCEINIKKNRSRIWLTDELLVFYNNSIPISIICSKFYQFEIKKLSIDTKNIIFEEFEFLSKYATDIFLSFEKMTYSNGKTVMLENILESIPHVKEFEFDFEKSGSLVINDSTVKNIAKLRRFENLELFYLFDVPETLNVSGFLDFMNYHNHIDFNVDFYIEYSQTVSEEYKAGADALIDAVIDSDLLCYIAYDGQDEGKLNIMRKRWNASYGNDIEDEEM